MAAQPDARTAQDLPGVLARRAEATPGKPFILTDDGAWSYAEIEAQAARLAGGLAQAGVARGETVLVMLPDRIETVLVWLAIARLGAIEVPVNVHYRGGILAYQIGDSRARTMVVGGGLSARVAEVLGEAAAGSGGPARLILTDDEPAPALPEGVETLRLGDLMTGAPWQGEGPRFNDLLAVMYTSGTTGPSKGATMTHAHAYEYAHGVTEMLDLVPGDVYSAPLPLFHIAGKYAVLYAACIAGATAVLPKPFSASGFWEEIRRHQATVSFLLGAMANFLHGQEPRDDDAGTPLDRVLMVPLIPEVETFKRRFGCRVSTTWGGTEMNCPTRSGFDLKNAKTCGRVKTETFEVRIVDEDDMEVGPGVPGEALVRAKEPWIISNGYWNHPEWTVTAWRNQWFHTGDLLMKDEDGDLYFVDRTKDAIRRRGENVSSFEVENEINAHPDVVECAVIPAVSSATEQEVMAVVVVKPGRRLDPAELIRFLEPRMAYFMVPRYVEIVESLPKTPTGKIRKFALREAGVTGSTWDREAAGLRLMR